ncbi:MAG: ferritin-like domain-containing protein [Halobacteriaceae archaeon]
MSVAARVDSDIQLARLLQIAVVLEEVVEARAARHYQQLPADERDPAIESLLEDARVESANHRDRLEGLVAALDADSIPYEDVSELVAEQYVPPGDTDGVLYDQLHGEETAYKFYADLITAIEEGDSQFSVDREDLLETLRELRDDEAAGVEEVAQLMGSVDGGEQS